MSVNRFNPDIAPEVGPRTYAETQGKPPFNWKAFLSNPPALWSTEHGAAARLSESWVTCACGNQCDIIPRNDGNAPEDAELYALGMQFTGAVAGGFWFEARTTLAAIERRSAELIATLTAPKHP